MINQYSCSSCGGWSCSPSECYGCPQQVTGNCVFYRGNTLPCTGITTGQTLNSILQTIDTAICNITTPSGYTTSVTGTSNQINVVSSIIGNNTNYQVSLSPTILTQLANNSNAISSIITILNTKIDTITSSTLTVTQVNSHTIDIEYTPATLNYNGVTFIDSSIHDNGGAGTLLSNTQNFITKSAINVGDQIIYKITGQFADATPNPIINININNTFGNLITLRASPSSKVGSSAFYVELSFFVISANTVILNSLWYNTIGSGVGTSPIYSAPTLINGNASILGKTISGVDFTNFIVGITQTNGISSFGYNFINLFTSEVKKKY